MTFQELCYHLEDNGCNIDPYFEESHFVTNCINLQTCIIENLDVYTNPTLCHYFYELGVPCPVHLRKEFQKYRNFREKVLDGLPLKPYSEIFKNKG